jgi:hypothetical protein
MKKYLIIAVLTLSPFLFSMTGHAEDIDLRECVSLGYDIGKHRGKLFCSALEARYRRGTVFISSTTSHVLFCEQAIAKSCRHGFVDQRYENETCNSLINANWQNALADWNEALNTGCPEPQVVTCPPNTAEVYGYVWCKSREDSYYAYYQGRWWRYTGPTQGSDGHSMHVIVSPSGTTATVYTADLILVKLW